MPIKGFKGKYRPFSNFWELKTPIVLRNPATGIAMSFRTSEYAYQAGKTLVDKEREAIRQAPSPGIAKKMGSPEGYKGFHVTLRPDWNNVREPLMEALVRKKSKDQEILELLLSTGDELIEESNEWGDTFWGVCRGIGLNHLGRLWMKIRKEKQ